MDGQTAFNLAIGLISFLGGWVEKDNAFQARIRTPNGRISLGYFDNELDAAMAYNKKAYELHGEFAKLNDVGAL